VTLSLALGASVVVFLLREHDGNPPHDADNVYAAARLPVFCTTNVLADAVLRGRIVVLDLGVTTG
jgi:hypothetical protein